MFTEERQSSTEANQQDLSLYSTRESYWPLKGTTKNRQKLVENCDPFRLSPKEQEIRGHTKTSHYSFVSKQNQIERTFEKLASQWYEETAGISSVSKKLLDLSYLRIIALGPDVVPYILSALRRHPAQWFVALKALTGEDPVKSGASFEEAVEAWLEWGESKGLV